MKIKPNEIRYVIMNKPSGYVCALKDNLNQTVMDLIPEKIKGLHIVGRLDKDTTGVLILTNDGAYTHNATHPKKHVNKEYLITLKEDFDVSYIAKVEAGLEIDHGKTKLLPGKLVKVDKRSCLLTISEGKFHQVKKMFFALGNEVIKLHRSKFNDITVENIEEGSYKIVEELKKNTAN